jgi:hypothetical protein
MLLPTLLLLAAPVTVEKVLSREHPAFDAATARLTVGRDGMVYLASGRNADSYVLRVSRDGKDRFGGTVVYALHNATATADGVVATANGHFAHKVALYDRSLKPTGELADFLNSDALGWSAPPHVEAGASGDFYGLDHSRDRIVRLDARGKQLKAYPIPRRPDKSGQAWDFRVCEKTESFFVLPHGGPLYRVGFDGEVKWVLDAKIDPGVRFGSGGNAGGFDVDDAGRLWMTGPASDEARIVSPEGKLERTLKLTGGPSGGAIRELCVHGGDVILRRRGETELFRVHDARTGAFRHAVQAQHERLRVTLASREWTAGESAALKAELEGGKAPRWRAWLRSLDETDDVELTWKDGRVEVPKGLGGVYLLTVSPDVSAWRGGERAEHSLRTWVTVRKKGADGVLSVWARGRTRFARGEEVPLTVLLRCKEKGEERVVLRLVEARTGKAVAEQEVVLTRNEPYSGPRAVVRCTAELAPGRYLLTADAPGRTVAPQLLVIGPGRLEEPGFWMVQYGDYRETYPQGDAWDLPVLSAGHVERARKLGFNLFVDRLGFPTHAGAARPPRKPPEYDEMIKALAADPAGPAPGKYALPAVALAPVLDGYSAEGMRQMAILMGNDAGLPLGTGFDHRKPDALLAEIDRVTTALKPWPAFRGWSWSSNWWVFHERGVNAARSPEEKKAAEAALAEAKKSGKWAPILDTLAARRLGYARDAQAQFNVRLAKHGKFVTASAAPYRNVESYPPVSLSNVDEVDLQAQWEQIAVPYAAAHGVDFYRRPGKPAWMHPEAWNDSGTGGQVVPTLFLGLMRGADGVGCSGPVPPWAPRPRDGRSGHHGIASMWRAVGETLRQYGPWLRTLTNNDRVAIVVSGRMLKIDDWPSVYGTHFARLFEAYAACLHAHHPATYVFVDDLKPGVLERFKAVLVIDQRVEFEPELLAALRAAQKAGVQVFHDGTSRRELVKGFTPLEASFTRFEKDPSPASDDAAYERFPRYALATVPAIRKALDPVAARVAVTDEAEVLMSERVAGKGRYVFAVNHSTMPHGPGRMWRQNLLVATRRPVVAKVDLGPDARHVYEVMAMKKAVVREGVAIADFRDLDARLFAVLPAEIHSVRLVVPAKVKAGQPFQVKFTVLDHAKKPIDAGIPVRIRALGEDQHVWATVKGGEASFTVPRSAVGEHVTVEVHELLSGLGATASVPLDASAPPRTFAASGAATAVGERLGKPAPDLSDASADLRFGPHFRDVALSADGKTAHLSSFGWQENVHVADVAKGMSWLRQSRVGQGFTYEPRVAGGSVFVQGFDFATSEGYHLYRLDEKGRATRRYALYGTPGRLPHRFVPSILGDRLNQFAVAPDGSWVASAGNLGLVVWDTDGKEVWRRDWWKTGEPPGLLHAVGRDALLLARGVEVSALSPRDGKPLWHLRLAPSGETVRIRSTPDGKTAAVLTDADGGRLFVLRGGKVAEAIPVRGDDFALSPDGGSVAVVSGRRLAFLQQGEPVWSMPADDVLHHPCFSPDGLHVACSSEAGTLYVTDAQGRAVFRGDLGAVAVPAFLPDGGLIAAGWMGRLAQLRKEGGRLVVTTLKDRLERADPGGLLAQDRTPTSRVAGWGNALPRPLPLTPNLLSPSTVRIDFTSSMHHAPLVGKPEALVDGKADAPAEPWLAWPTVGWFAETKTFNALQFYTFRRRLRVEAVTLVEDAKHPESWLRDCRLEWWDPATEQWKLAGRLLSDAAVHSHRLEKPAEASRWRLVPSGLSGNLRLAEVVFHGTDLGSSHPDVIAKRPVAVLFDEGDELKAAGMVHPTWGLSFAFGGASSGGRYLRMEADRSAAPVWKPPFGHVLPDWDFEVTEKPGPGQYRYLRFAAKALDEKTTGLVLRVDGDGYGKAVSCFAGAYKKEADAIGHQVADAPPREWAVYTVDLWAALKKTTRLRGLRLSATGGPAGFDRVLLLREVK